MSGDSYKINDQYATYFLTLTVINWTALLIRKEYRDLLVKSLNYCIKHKGLVLNSWVIMTNHVHLVGRVESEIGKEDYLPMEADYGELWYWNGATLKHGNKLNDTGKARVSVDFRIIPVAKYVDEGKQSITNKTKMVLGEYWKAC